MHEKFLLATFRWIIINYYPNENFAIVYE